MADHAIPSTKAVWPNYSAINEPIGKAGPADSLGKDEFLKILVAQISNQSPLEPMGDAEFIAQMAQFTALEQMMNIADAMNRLSGSLGLYSSMIGKRIGWEEIGSDGMVEVRTGIVEAIVVKDGRLHAVSGDRSIPIDEIISVAEDDGSAPDDGGEEGEAS